MPLANGSEWQDRKTKNDGEASSEAWRNFTEEATFGLELGFEE